MMTTLALVVSAMVAGELLRPQGPPRTWEDDYDDMVDRYEVRNLRPGTVRSEQQLRDELLMLKDAKTNPYRLKR